MASSLISLASLILSAVLAIALLLMWQMGRRRLVLQRRLGEAYDKIVSERGHLFGEADMARALRRYDRAVARLIDDEWRPRRGQTLKPGPPLR